MRITDWLYTTPECSIAVIFCYLTDVVVAVWEWRRLQDQVWLRAAITDLRCPDYMYVVVGITFLGNILEPTNWQYFLGLIITKNWFGEFLFLQEFN